jgi:hypothetical protein
MRVQLGERWGVRTERSHDEVGRVRLDNRIVADERGRVESFEVHRDDQTHQVQQWPDSGQHDS